MCKEVEQINVPANTKGSQAALAIKTQQLLYWHSGGHLLAALQQLHRYISLYHTGLREQEAHKKNTICRSRAKTGPALLKDL